MNGYEAGGDPFGLPVPFIGCRAWGATKADTGCLLS
jgi:hypothetical protein